MLRQLILKDIFSSQMINAQINAFIGKFLIPYKQQKKDWKWKMKHTKKNYKKLNRLKVMISKKKYKVFRIIWKK